MLRTVPAGSRYQIRGNGEDLMAIFETSKIKSLKSAYGILDCGTVDYQFNLKSIKGRA